MGEPERQFDRWLVFVALDGIECNPIDSEQVLLVNTPSMFRFIFPLIIFASIFTTSSAQCEFLNLTVSASDSGYVQLYHPGYFMFGATENVGGFENQCFWTVRTMAGDILHEATTTGEWAEQSFLFFDHNLAVTDSMVAELVLSNPMEPMDCCMADTLVWVEDPIFEFGNWSVNSLNTGVLCQTSTDLPPHLDASIRLFPQPTRGTFQLQAPASVQTLVLFNSSGRQVASFDATGSRTFDISPFPDGLYLVQMLNGRQVPMAVQRLIKIQGAF